MRIKNVDICSWDVSPKEAVAIQNNLRDKVVLEDFFDEISLIAGADISLGLKGRKGYAGVVVYQFPDLAEVERKGASFEVKFPYVPGLLSFREAPGLLDVFEMLDSEPDLVVFDGQGYAHPRRMGIATHMGLILDLPTIGCAKSRLVGKHGEPGPEVGDYAELVHKGETIGAVLRTREKVKPVFISPGHKISLESSISIMRQCADGYRIPKPTREADKYVARLKRGEEKGVLNDG